MSLELVLKKRPAYEGSAMSLGGLERELSEVRQRQDESVKELAGIRLRSQDVALALDVEMKKLARLSKELLRRRKLKDKRGLWAWMVETFGGGPITRGSIEKLLKDQYQVACVRVREAGDAADRLRHVEQELRAEVERLGARIHEAAKNQEKAEAFIEELRTLLGDHEAAAARLSDKGGSEHAGLQAAIDRAKNLIGEHRTQAALFKSGVERFERLRRSTLELTAMVNDLYTDIATYVEGASAQLDQASLQIQAVGAAADATAVLLEMKRSLDLLGESVRQTSRFVSETQLYFREHMDRLLEDLELYDRETLRVLEKNRRESAALAEIQEELAR